VGRSLGVLGWSELLCKDWAPSGVTRHKWLKEDFPAQCELIEEHSGKFEPQKMPNEYARAVHELVQAKIEQRAPEVEAEKRETPKVVNIMDALKKSIQAKGQTKVREAVSKRMGKKPSPAKSAPPRRTGKQASRDLH
jgi:DNA end-binding protein Ku